MVDKSKSNGNGSNGGVNPHVQTETPLDAFEAAYDRGVDQAVTTAKAYSLGTRDGGQIIGTHLGRPAKNVAARGQCLRSRSKALAKLAKARAAALGIDDGDVIAAAPKAKAPADSAPASK